VFSLTICCVVQESDSGYCVLGEFFGLSGVRSS
jgi:hypothetical protein